MHSKLSFLAIHTNRYHGTAAPTSKSHSVWISEAEDVIGIEALNAARLYSDGSIPYGPFPDTGTFTGNCNSKLMVPGTMVLQARAIGRSKRSLYLYYYWASAKPNFLAVIKHSVVRRGNYHYIGCLVLSWTLWSERNATPDTTVPLKQQWNTKEFSTCKVQDSLGTFI